MFRTLHSRLAIGLAALFVALGATMLVAAQLGAGPRIGATRLVGLGSIVGVGGAAFGVLVAFIVWSGVSRRLRCLGVAMDAFRAGAGAFLPAERSAAGARHGDEIEGLGIAFHELSLRIASQMRRLEQADQQRCELVANVAHDLRTPLTIMQGYLEILLARADRQSPQDSRKYLELVTRQCERLGRLVHDLFELATLDACEVRPDMEVFPIAELAQDVIQKFSLAAEKCSLTLVARYQKNSLPVRADIGMIERILDNLIENAMRYTPPGGQIGIGIQLSGQRVELRVSDSGKGMAGDELRALFGRYGRADGRPGADGHAGLGLAITRRLVQLHGGDVVVHSTPGKGTTFIIDLPAA